MNLATPTSTAYNLNQGQKQAADAFFEFLFAPEKEFIISGPAGVGKTYLMNYIIDQTMPRYLEICKLVGVRPEFNNVIMTATTNKAAEVLSNAVRRPTQTVHSFFNLVVYDDFKTGETRIKQTDRWKIHQNRIIFIDEASMIDSNLWKMLHDGTQNCKLVYVGDRHQLAPVLEDLSPIYKHNSPMIELLEPVRNAGQPALMSVCQQLRQTVETGVFKPIQIVPGVIDLLDSQQMQAEIDQQFQKQTQKARILAYTNKRVIAYNDHIRGVRRLPAQFQPGEFLVNNQVFHHKRGQLPIEAELEVLRCRTSGQVLIDPEHQVYLDVDLLDVDCPLYGGTLNGGILTNVPYPTNRAHFDALMKHYTKVKNWRLRAMLRNDFADLRPRDAATVHKSQGSTYETVFVDLANISTCHNPSQAARMLYVAFSRARSRIVLYGDLAPKYGGLVLP